MVLHALMLCCSTVFQSDENSVGVMPPELKMTNSPGHVRQSATTLVLHSPLTLAGQPNLEEQKHVVGSATCSSLR